MNKITPHAELIDKLIKVEHKIDINEIVPIDDIITNLTISGIPAWHTDEYIIQLQHMFTDKTIPLIREINNEYNIKITSIIFDIT